MYAPRRSQRSFKPASIVLEDRLALSTLPPVAHKIHTLARRAASSKGVDTGTMRLVDGTDLELTQLHVAFGKVKLSGSGFGTLSNGQLVDGEIDLSGPQGTVTLELLGGPLKKSGKHASSMTSAFVITGTTGDYGPAAGFAGDLEIPDVPTFLPSDPMPRVIVHLEFVFFSPPRSVAEQVWNDIAIGYGFHAPPQQ
jgi:hypothetical protein